MNRPASSATPASTRSPSTPAPTFVAALVLLGIAAAVFPAPLLAGPITIGPGPALGTDRAGVTWYEDFQDWTAADCKALDEAGTGDALYRFNDGLDDSRDLVAFYEREENGNLYFRVDLYDLALGAENGGLDLYLAIDAAAGGQIWLPDNLDCQTDRPWELCINVYRAGAAYGSDYRIYDKDWNNVTGAYLGSYFNSQVDAVEFGITRQALLNAGWNGTSPLTFQVFTAKDGAETNCTGGGRSSDLADAIVDSDRGCSDGVLNGGISSTAQAGVVYYATIAHGNQSVNRAGAIGAHIYDSQANTGIPGGTGFLRTLDTHEIFRVPLNVHPSGTLTIACNWARKPGGAADPQDGPAFLARVRDFVDADQGARPGSLIGGALAEHILPYFEGPVNAASLAVTDSLNQVIYGVSAADAKVMHTPERVIRSQDTGLSPLDGRTFEDIAASPYAATYLDEVTHLHGWFYPGESCTPDQGYRHKVHRINGVYCFMINDREDQAKFANLDGGVPLDTRYSLLQKALYGGSSEIVVVFDDWEALAGKSFDPTSGNPIPNNNPNQYHNTVRWLANHPWVRISNLKDLLALALANPSAFVIDHGTRYDLPIQTYEWLKHASEDSYHYWYYDSNAGLTGNEQSFYDLVPVLTGKQGDYHARGETPAQDGPPLPSGKKHGDLNTPGTLMYEAWQALQGAPAGRMRDLGVHSYLAMIYETAWHEEDQTDYTDSNCYGAWLNPDGSWDGVNTWALRLQNHVRGAGLYAAAAQWAAAVRAGTASAVTEILPADLDFDGEPEYVLRNDRAYVVFERYGGRCVLACAYDPATQDAQVIVGAPYTNPSAPGEEEYTGPGANRCSAFKEMNGGVYADAPDTVTVLFPVCGPQRSPGSTMRQVAGRPYENAPGPPNALEPACDFPPLLEFRSGDGRIVKTASLGSGSYVLDVDYEETVSGPLYVRLGLSPNPLDLALHGQAHLSGTLDAPNHTYLLQNSAGGGALLDFGGATFDATPADAGTDRRDLALTEEVEVRADGPFALNLTLIPGLQVIEVPAPATPARFSVTGPVPSPSTGAARLDLALPERTCVRIEVADLMGRRVATQDLGTREPGLARVSLDPRDDAGAALQPGLYFVRVVAGTRATTRRWVVVR